VAEACLKAALAVLALIAIGVLFGSALPESSPGDQAAAEVVPLVALEQAEAQSEEGLSTPPTASHSLGGAPSPPSGTTAAASPSPSATIRAAGAPTCKLGESFTSLVRAIGESAVGRCVEDEFVNLLHGDTHQRTSRGLLVWRKEPGVAKFDDGTMSWYGCPQLVVRRPSQEQPPC
jgi:hypothetical protein